MTTARLCIASQKGGCGKTTTALNLALALAERGQATLLVDLDPQGAVGLSLCKGETELAGVADALMGACAAEDAVLRTHQPNLSLMPRGRLDPVDACEYERALLQPQLLDTLLTAVEPDYDIVILDTPSGLGITTRAALEVSHFVLLPVQAEPLSLRGIGQALRVVEHVRERGDGQLQMLGILPTMVDRDNDISMGVLVAAWRELCGVLETTIPRADVFLRASEQGVPLSYLGGKKPAEARRFGALADEVYGLIAAHSMEVTHDEPARRLL